MPKPALPAGLYEALITEGLARILEGAEGEGFYIERAALEEAEGHEHLAWHLYAALRRHFRRLPAQERLAQQAALTNRLLEQIEELGERVGLPPELLRAVALPRARRPDGTFAVPPRPEVPLAESDLLVNARGEPSVGHALAQEIESADAIDLVCAFIRWNGLRVLLPALEAFRSGGRRLRVLTTTYVGATEKRALDHLCELGAEVKVSYETRSTRLHAKAWLLRRESGFSTAYVGSSNLSYGALHDGLEWNVRLSAVRNTDVLEKFAATFDAYWEDAAFELYRPGRDGERFERALAAARGGRGGAVVDLNLEDWAPGILDVHPYPHQEEILEALDAARQRHARHRNLVVAATGTGKTVVAALDYRRLCRAAEATHKGGSLARPRLLFVAHRKEILTQSLRTFRTVLRDGAFGELYVDGEMPSEWRHVFASVQSLARVSDEGLRPDQYDVVIVDEFHHAAAPTYDRLLKRLAPRELLGLTATPERGDGQSVLHWFDGRIAAEIRLWEALERQLLVPFQYFGIHDGVDLSAVRWRRGGYEAGDLENLYTGDDVRVRLVLEQLRRVVGSPLGMRALGFCVSIRHAEFMAERFCKAGIPAQAVSADSHRDDRAEALRALRERRVNALFAVDLFNEGVDVPDIDTVLFLRPTESPTVFLQQLGRGLRHAEGKSCLTVLDFIGRAHGRFRFDRRYRALTGATRAGVRQAIEQGFPYLPAGCSLQLDRVARDVVLENVRQAIGSTRRSLVEELRSLGRDVALAEFLGETDLELEDVYRFSGLSWSALRRAAGLPCPPEGPDEARLTQGLRAMLHLDDGDRISFYGSLLAQREAPGAGDLTEREVRLVLGLVFALWGRGSRWSSLEEPLERLWRHPALVAELRDLLEILEDRASHVVEPLEDVLCWSAPVPLAVHARYSLSDVLTAFDLMNLANPHLIREGVKYDERTRCDVLFVTLEKAEDQYSPTTLYKDYAVSPTLFHWESQSTTSAESATGQRYIRHTAMGSHVLLFVRRKKQEGNRTLSYTCLGPARYVRHKGSRPMAILWELARPMPADLFAEARMAAG